MIKKEYTKTGRSCRVTFELPPGSAERSVSVVGDFNDWNEEATPLKRRRDGSFSTTISAKPGRRYHFRYLIDGHRWENDPAADKYAPNPFGTEDSVIEV